MPQDPIGQPGLIGPFTARQAFQIASREAARIAANHFARSAAGLAGRTVGRYLVGSATPKDKKKGSKKPFSVRVQTDGVGAGRSVRNKKRARKSSSKKSLTKRVKALEKNAPKDSVKDFIEITPFKIKSNTTLGAEVNCIALGALRCFNAPVYEVAMADMGGFDARAVNSHIKVRNRYTTLRMKVATTSNVTIKYAFYRCNDNSSLGPLARMLAKMEDRGLDITGMAVTGQTSGSSTEARYPMQLLLKDQKKFYPTFELNPEDWTRVTPVKSVAAGPGDMITISEGFGDTIYKPEVYDEIATSYMKGDIYLVYKIIPDIAHDATNHDAVGLSVAKFDAYHFNKFNLVWSDEKSLRVKQISHAAEATGFTVPNTVDNKASAVEAVNE